MGDWRAAVVTQFRGVALTVLPLRVIRSRLPPTETTTEKPVDHKRVDRTLTVVVGLGTGTISVRNRARVPCRRTRTAGACAFEPNLYVRQPWIGPV
jgi:hypothetical protein